MTDADPFAVMAEHAGHTDAPDGSGCIPGTNLDQKKCAPWFLAYNSPPVRLVRRVADEIREYFPEGDDRSLEWAAGGAIGALLEEGWLDAERTHMAEWKAGLRRELTQVRAVCNELAETLAEVRAEVHRERVFSADVAAALMRERGKAAAAWDEGYTAGGLDESDAYWVAGAPGTTANPYR